MRIRHTWILLIAAFSFLVNSQSSFADIYGYIFSESTGQNNFVLIKKIRTPIEFDRKLSDRQALYSLIALKASVLCFNSDGSKIFLDGNQNKTTGTFILKSWHIMAPFEVGAQADDFSDTPKIQRHTKSTLSRSDFNKSKDFDPESAEFDPKRLVYSSHNSP